MILTLILSPLRCNFKNKCWVKNFDVNNFELLIQFNFFSFNYVHDAFEKIFLKINVEISKKKKTTEKLNALELSRIQNSLK